MAVHDLMSSTKRVADLAECLILTPLMRLEYEDIELVHSRLGKLLNGLRKDHEIKASDNL
jgi:hypothetical protein